MVKISELSEDDEKDFRFAEHQLGVIDTKANNVLMVDSVLIVISSLGLIFSPDADVTIRGLMIGATIFVLASVGLCLRTIWTSWATDEGDISMVVKIRNRKTNFLHASLVVLAIALGLFVMTFVLDYLNHL